MHAFFHNIILKDLKIYTYTWSIHLGLYIHLLKNKMRRRQIKLPHFTIIYLWFSGWTVWCNSEQNQAKIILVWSQFSDVIQTSNLLLSEVFFSVILVVRLCKYCHLASLLWRMMLIGSFVAVGTHSTTWWWKQSDWMCFWLKGIKRGNAQNISDLRLALPTENYV